MITSLLTSIEDQHSRTYMTVYQQMKSTLPVTGDLKSTQYKARNGPSYTTGVLWCMRVTVIMCEQ